MNLRNSFLKAILRYETKTILEQYLLFHYGADQDLLPFPFGPQHSLHFPVRCVTECLDVKALPSNAKGLDLGCSVGRSSFELARHCKSVLGVDSSQTFISAAQEIQEMGQLEYTIMEEGAQRGVRQAKIPEDIDPQRVIFRCCDIMELQQESTTFDVVLAANLLCRVSDPLAFLLLLSKLVSSKGQLILISPYSWLEEFTPRNRWLGERNENDKSALECIREILEKDFELQRCFNIAFLMREHLRKYQWGISQATMWKRK